jgi:ADP-ribosylation factor 2-binding protein
MINIMSSLSSIDSANGLKGKAISSKDEQFDSIIGHIEDILMLDDWVELCNDFFSTHAPFFDDDEDSNKLEYTQIFEAYQEQMESFIEKYLNEQVVDFSMQEFLNRELLQYADTSIELAERKGQELEGDVFDVLLSLSDFTQFKEQMLAFKSEENGTALDLSDLLQVSKGAE